MAAWTHRDTTNPTTNVATYTSNSFTPTQGDLLVVMPAIGATTAAGACTASANGITFTRITSAARGGIDTQYLFVADQLVPASPVAMTVTADVTGDDGTGCVMFVATIAGMSRTGASAVRQFDENNAASGTPAVTLPAACLTGNPVVAFMQNVSSPAGVTEPSGFTERGDTGYATPTKGAEYATANSGITATTITWGSASATAWSAIVAEFDPSAAGSSGNLPTTSETDTAQTLTGSKAGTLPTSTESDSAQPLTGSKTETLPMVSETDTATQLAAAKAGSLPAAVEVDTAEAFTAGPIVGDLPTAVETDTALALTAVKAGQLVAAAELDAAQQLTAAKVGALQTAIETDTAGVFQAPVAARDITVVAETPPVTAWTDTAPITGWTDTEPTTAWSDTEPILVTAWTDTEPTL